MPLKQTREGAGLQIMPSMFPRMGDRSANSPKKGGAVPDSLRTSRYPNITGREAWNAHA